MVSGDYKIIFMRRDYEEIRQSFEAFFNSSLKMKEKQYNTAMKDTLDILRNRKDVDFVEIWYRDVINDPKNIFKLLRDKGWPIDISQAVKVVDPKLCRFKKEILTIGI